MAYTFKVTRRVEFADTDAAGIMHFSRFFVLMEQTEHAFLRSLGLSVHQQTPDGIISFVRVEATCHYLKPLHFEEEVEVRLAVRNKTDKSITYDFVFHLPGCDPPVDAASGSLTVVCICKRNRTETMTSVSIPPQMDRRIEDALHDTDVRSNPKD